MVPSSGRRPEFFLAMSAEMANEIKLISGRSHPELSDKIAKRYDHPSRRRRDFQIATRETLPPFAR